MGMSGNGALVAAGTTQARAGRRRCPERLGQLGTAPALRPPPPPPLLLLLLLLLLHTLALTRV